MGDQSDVRDRVEDEETRSRTLSDAPLAILQCPRQLEILACLPACIQGQVIVAGPGAWPQRRITICSESSAGLRLSCRRARRGPSSEDESVASTPLQEMVFRPIGWSQCSHTTLPAFVLNVVVVRRCGRTTQEIRQTTGVVGPSFPNVITRRELALRYGFPPEHPAREDNARDQHTDTSWTVGRSC